MAGLFGKPCNIPVFDELPVGKEMTLGAFSWMKDVLPSSNQHQLPRRLYKTNAPPLTC